MWSWSPSPQDVEHFPAGDHAPQPPFTAQASTQITRRETLSAVVVPGQLGSSLQFCLWTWSPGQLSPGGLVWPEGAGLEQDRWRVLLGHSCTPAMHEPEQPDQPDQADQPP